MGIALVVTDAGLPVERYVEGQWSRVASVWSHVGPPLRPSAEDLGFFAQAVAETRAPPGSSALRGLILGVTPELYALPWPDPAQVVAVDRSPEMIEHVWPGPPSQIRLADWREAPLAAASIDVALCDGGLQLLDWPDGQAQLRRALAQRIATGGTFAVRLFLPPAERESPDQVVDELMAGRIPDLNCLKLRLGIALQKTASGGVELDTVWRTLRALATSWEELAARLGWPLSHLLAIDAYRGSAARYYFANREEIVDLFQKTGWFECVRVSVPRYLMGTQCPTVVFRRTGKMSEGA